MFCNKKEIIVMTYSIQERYASFEKAGRGSLERQLSNKKYFAQRSSNLEKGLICQKMIKDIFYDYVIFVPPQAAVEDKPFLPQGRGTNEYW